MKRLTESDLAEFLTSLKAVMIPMLMMLFALVIMAGLLINSSFPDTPDLLRWISSALLGFALAYPLTLSSVNSHLLTKRIVWGYIGFPEFFGLCSVIMAMLFFEVFNPKNLTFAWLASRIFLSILFGVVEYLYAHLFVSRNALRIDGQELEKKFDALTISFSELTERHDALKLSYNELKADRDALKVSHDALQKELICPHCKHISDNLNKAKRHNAKCIKNPKNEES